MPEPIAEAELADGRAVSLIEVGPERAVDLLAVSRAAFAARPALGAPPAALSDTAESLAGVLREGRGYLLLVEDAPAASLVEVRESGVARLGRVSVLPEYQRLGLASFAVAAVTEEMALRGEPAVTVLARKEYAPVQQWWARRGFEQTGESGNCWVLTAPLPIVVEAPDAEVMRAIGRRLASVLAPGDLLVASGNLGAGKTTLTQGIGDGLGVSGPVISPTFVLSRIHPPVADGPALVHVDAYRLGDAAELEDLDLDASMADSVTLVEWGTGLAEGLASDRLEIDIRRGLDPDDETRRVFFTPVGERWDRAALAAVLREGNA